MGKEVLSFEESLIELEKIAKQLESDDISLDTAIELFKKGIELSKDCNEKLKNAKQEIESIAGFKENK